MMMHLMWIEWEKLKCKCKYKQMTNFFNFKIKTCSTLLATPQNKWKDYINMNHDHLRCNKQHIIFKWWWKVDGKAQRNKE